MPLNIDGYYNIKVTSKFCVLSYIVRNGKEFFFLAVRIFSCGTQTLICDMWDPSSLTKG